jgi:hypothetical protein
MTTGTDLTMAKKPTNGIGSLVMDIMIMTGGVEGNQTINGAVERGIFDLVTVVRSIVKCYHFCFCSIP